MFIKSLTIKNFRCFGKDENGNGIKIDFSKDVTAFIGGNGNGKTAILEALHFLVGNDYLPNKISERDFHCEANEIKDEIVIEGEVSKPFFFEIDVITNQTNRPETVVIPCGGVRLSIKRRAKADRVLDDPFIINKIVVPLTGAIDDAIYEGADFKKSYKIISFAEMDGEDFNLESAKDAIKNLLLGRSIDIEQSDDYCQVAFKLKTSKEVRTAAFPSYDLNFNPNRIKSLAKSYYLKKDRDEDVSGNFSLISKILTDLHWRYKREQIKNGSNTIKAEYETLSTSLRTLVDEKGALVWTINEKVREICSEEKDLQIDFIDIEQPYKSAFVAKKEGEKLLLPDNLGSGFNILIAYALFAYVAEKEKTPIILIIDEPELHLHSDWQGKMYDIFTKPSGLQIVYSTQSENFISLKEWRQIKHIKDNKIYPDKNECQTQRQSTDGTNGTIAQFLDDYAARNLHISLILKENLELFFTKKCILVEGPAEKYALPKLLELYGCNLGDFSISIISVWGKTKIKVYQMICKCFGIDYYTLFDHDRDEAENTYIEANAQAGKIRQFSTSFEDKLGIGKNEDKFQKMVEIVDGTANVGSLDQEINDCLGDLKNFIEK